MKDIPLGDLQKLCNASLEVRGQSVGLAARSTGEAVGKVHQSPAAGRSHLGVACKTNEEGGDKRLKVSGGIDRFGTSLANAAKGVSGRVPDMDNRVLHHTDQNRQSLLDQGIQHLLLGTLHDRTECRDRGITEVPVLRAQVLLHEGKDGRHNSTADSLSPELQALVGSTGDVILVVGSILILLGEQLEENRDDLLGCDAGEVEVLTELGRALCIGLHFGLVFFFFFFSLLHHATQIAHL